MAYMFANLVKEVTFICQHCNTSITFDVIKDDFKELSKATEHLICPKCSEAFSSARSMAHAIYEYNNAAYTLNDTAQNTHSELT